MPTSKHSAGPGLLISELRAARSRGAAVRLRGKRNPWVVIAFMTMLVATWINSLL